MVLSRDPDGRYNVSAPDLDGCFTYGDTFEEAIANAQKAIEGTLLTFTDLGEVPPHPSAISVSVRTEYPLKAAS